MVAPLSGSRRTSSAASLKARMSFSSASLLQQRQAGRGTHVKPDNTGRVKDPAACLMSTRREHLQSRVGLLQI